MWSFRRIRIFGSWFLVGIILCAIVLYGKFQYDLIGGLQHITEVDEKEVGILIDIMRLNNELKDTFREIVLKREFHVAGVVFLIDNLFERLDSLKALHNRTITDKGIEKIVLEGRRFKNALFGYSREVKGGYSGSTARELEIIILESAEELAHFFDESMADLNKAVKMHNQMILAKLRKLNTLLIPILFVSLIFIIFVIFIINYAYTNSVKALAQAMDRVSAGDLSYRIPVIPNDEVGKLASSFNKMSQDLLASEEKSQNAYRLVSKVTDGIEEMLLLVDADSKIIWVNKNVGKFFGLKEEKFINKDCCEALPFLEGFCPKKNLAGTKIFIKTATVLREYNNKNNEKTWLEITFSPQLDDKGNFYEGAYIIRDVSHRLKQEEELKENISSLGKTKIDLQAKMSELERFNRLAVDRELRMIELKRKIKELGGQLLPGGKIKPGG